MYVYAADPFGLAVCCGAAHRKTNDNDKAIGYNGRLGCFSAEKWS